MPSSVNPAELQSFVSS